MSVRIGDDRREAIDWLQDRLVVTRPQAEQAMISLLREGTAVTTDEGIMLTEDEEETESRARSKVEAHHMSAWKGMHFRRKGKISLNPKNLKHQNKIVRTDHNSNAEEMLRAQAERKRDEEANFEEERVARIKAALHAR